MRKSLFRSFDNFDNFRYFKKLKIFFRSKKQAKHAAALQCLQSGFIQIKDTNLSQQAMQVQMMENNIDFTSDDPMDQKGLNFELEPSSDSKLILNKKSSHLKIGEKRKLEEIQNSAAAADQQDQKPVTKKMKISASDKNPVIFSGFLNTFFPFSFLHFSFFFCQFLFSQFRY